MASRKSRGQIVLDALALAGRSTELKQSGNGWLNYFLLDVGLTYRFPELRKVGATLSLGIGFNTVPLPTDLGAGMAKSGMIFGPDNKPLQELAWDDFVNTNGFPPNNATGRPYIYVVDRQAGVFRFNFAADQAYPLTPTYYMTPPLVDEGFSSDTQSVWIDNDMIAVQGLMWMIYQFTEDAREDAQEARVEKLLRKYERSRTEMGGQSRVLLSPARFKTVKFGGYYGI